MSRKNNLVKFLAFAGMMALTGACSAGVDEAVKEIAMLERIETIQVSKALEAIEALKASHANLANQAFQAIKAIQAAKECGKIRRIQELKGFQANQKLKAIQVHKLKAIQALEEIQTSQADQELREIQLLKEIKADKLLEKSQAIEALKAIEAIKANQESLAKSIKAIIVIKEIQTSQADQELKVIQLSKVLEADQALRALEAVQAREAIEALKAEALKALEASRALEAKALEASRALEADQKLEALEASRALKIDILLLKAAKLIAIDRKPDTNPAVKAILNNKECKELVSKKESKDWWDMYQMSGIMSEILKNPVPTITKDQVKAKHIIVGDYSYHSYNPVYKPFEDCVLYLDAVDDHKSTDEDYVICNFDDDVIYLDEEDVTGRLVIGKFCWIMDGVKFIMRSMQDHQRLKRDTIIGNAVSIGSRAAFVPGIKIGDGAVIKGYSFVTKDVGPYEVWEGNPAKLVGKLFSDEKIEKLLQVKWWDWSIDEIRNNLDLICSTDADDLWDKFLEDQEESSNEVKSRIWKGFDLSSLYQLMNQNPLHF
jgi:chloramphenicol O-acetyltransferase type B